jgi:hypothetical protein
MVDFTRLSEPFPANDVEWRIGKTNAEKTQGMALAYITNRAIQQRLDDVCGPQGWYNLFSPWKDGKGQLCGIAIKCGDEWIVKWDGADDTDFESLKGGLSDSMKRAAVQWGIGRYLYSLDAVWVKIKGIGKSFAIDGKPPVLPTWALPKGSKDTQVYEKCCVCGKDVSPDIATGSKKANNGKIYCSRTCITKDAANG